MEEYSFLGKVSSHDDLVKLSNIQMAKLADEIRDKIINTVAKNGGHLASNLGVVELTLALNYVFDFKSDSVIFDVGHQVYPHKLITGRYDQFHTLRQYQGISGFSKITESAYDAFGAGHASTSISAAVGIAKAKQLTGDDSKTVAIIGDGALTGGMSFEALNYLGHTKDNVIIIINDNEMSISKNVGALTKVLSNLRVSRKYKNFKLGVKTSIRKMSGFGSKVSGGISKSKSALKQMIYGNMFFEDLGLTYYGVVDGHDIKELVEVLNVVKNSAGPVVVHVKTVKGKGYHPAQSSPSEYHGVSALTKKTTKENMNLSYSEVVVNKLNQLAEKHNDITAITAAMESGTKLELFKEKFADRFFDVGIAEQHAMTMAAGMAKAGLKPYFAVYSTFLQRAYDQLIHDVALQNLPVTVLVDRCGLVGDDGPTHHGVFDMPIFMSVPNLTVYSPYDEQEIEFSIKQSYEENSPVLIRYPRGKVHQSLGINASDFTFINKKTNITLVSFGAFTKIVLDAISELEKLGIMVNHLHFVKVKPIDFKKVAYCLKETDFIVTIEDSVGSLGFGVYLKNKLQKENVISSFEILGYQDDFVEQGSINELNEAQELTSKRIVKKVKQIRGLYISRGNLDD